MKPALLRRVLVGTGLLALGGVGLYIYLKYVVYAGPTLAFSRHGQDYELLAPRMLGIALLAPYFLWIIGRSLADLPPVQRVVSALLRIAFVVLLALGLSRLARTATTEKVCTVYLVDVSDSVPDLAIEDARGVIGAGLHARGKEDLARVVTFARRPRLVTMADDAKESPPLPRHDTAGAGSATDLASALQLAYGLFPAGYLRHVVLLSDGVQTDGDVLAEAERAHRFGVEVSTIPYKRPVPGEVALRSLRAPDKVEVGQPFELHADIFSSRPQQVKATLKQGEAINGLDGVRTLDLKAGANDVAFKSVVRIAGEVTYALDLTDIPEDRFRENNRAVVSVAVPGRPSVLYVEGQPQRASYLASALSAQDFDVDVRGPRELPSSLRELERYDFVILSDTPAEAVSLTQQDTTRSTSATSAAASSSPAGRAASAWAAGSTPPSSASSR